MSKRLQVLIDEREYGKFAKQARTEGKSLGAWVRDSLRAICQQSVSSSPEAKMNRLREIAQRSSLPSSDIDSMLREVDQGYRDDLR